MFAGYSDVNSGIVQNLFTVSGSGTVLGARYAWYLPRIGDLDQKVTFGVDYRAYRNSVQIGGIGLVPDITVRPLSVAWSGSLRSAAGTTQLFAGYHQNLPGGNDGSDPDFKAARAQARAAYRILRYGVSHAHALPAGWQLRVALDGQETGDALVSGEQYGLGGPDSVRGFQIREVAGDRGVRSSLELYTPDLATHLGWRDVALRIVGFYDMGSVSRNQLLPGESPGQSIASTGIGLRVAYGRRASLRLDAAQVIESGGARERNEQRVTGALSVAF